MFGTITTHTKENQHSATIGTDKTHPQEKPLQCTIKACRMGRSDKVSLWYVALLINTRFRFFKF